MDLCHACLVRTYQQKVNRAKGFAVGVRINLKYQEQNDHTSCRNHVVYEIPQVCCRPETDRIHSTDELNVFGL